MLVFTHICHQVKLLFVVLEVIAALVEGTSLQLFRDFLKILAVHAQSFNENVLFSLCPLVGSGVRSCELLAGSSLAFTQCAVDGTHNLGRRPG